MRTISYGRTLGMVGVVGLVTAGSVRPALAQRAVLYPDGRCHYEVPTGSWCHRATGECYSHDKATFLGNWLTDCNFDGTTATASVPPTGGVHPDTCSAGGESCPDGQSDCCTGDYNLQCKNVSGFGDICVHTGTGGVNGGCVSGGQDCYGDLQCMWNSGESYGQTCQSKPNTDGWTAITYAPVVTGITGIQARFNYIDSSFTVPAAPRDATKINHDILWNGFQTSGGDELIQPEVWFNGSSSTWRSWVQYSKNGVFLNAVSDETTYAGDNVELAAWIVENNVSGEGDYWYGEVLDNSNDNNVLSSLNMYTDGTGTGSGNPAFITAITSILEVQGQVDCNGLPDTEEVDFYLNALTQEGAAWNDYEDVIPYASFYADGYGATPSNGDVSSTEQPAAPAPSCAYGAEMINDDGSFIGGMTWDNTGG